MIIKIIFCFFVIHNKPLFCFYYIRQHINTQLKTVGESVSVISKLEEALKEIDNIGTVGMPRMAQVNRLLKETFADCSIEAAKMAISQSTLNKEQIELILSSKGLTGNILETTTAELANTTATTAMAATEGTATTAMAATEGTATTATVALGNAFKGLGAKIKAFVAANELLLTVAIGAAAVFAAVKIIDACTTSFDELKDKASDLRQEVDESQSSMDSTKKQLDEINQKIADINSKDGISLTDEEELKKLQEQKTELENIYEIEKARHDQKQQELEDTADEYLNKKFNSDYATETYSQKQMKNGQFVDVSYSRPKEVTKLEEMEAAYNTMVAKQKELNQLEEKYNQSSNHTDKDTKEYEKKKSELEKDRDNAKTTALDIQEEAKQQVQGLDSTSESYQKVMKASQGLSDALARLNNDWNGLSEDSKRKDLFSAISKGVDNSITDGLKEEYQKISDWGLDDYADQIKNGTIQSKFGNVDMDKRTIIHWSDELKKTYTDALSSWDYDPEIGSIDTVFGGSERFGEDLDGNGWEIAFTPILPDGTFLSKDTVEEYINSILAEAYADDGKVTEDELTAIDAEGRQIGDTFIKGIFAGIDDSQDYDNNGNWADVVGRLMHFSGKNGAVQILKNNKKSSSNNMNEIKDYLLTLSDDDLNILKDVKFDENTTVDSLKEVIKKAQEEADKNPVEASVAFDDPSSLLTETDDKSKTATLADLKSEADLMQSLQSEIAKTGNIGVDSMQKIIKQFPEAKQYLADYMSGLITEQELFSKLENVYAEDTQQYINSLVKKNETDADFFTNVKNNNETLFNGLAENYGFDIKNWNNLAKAKLDVDKQLMAELASIWTGYYTAQKDSVTGLYTLVTNPEFDVQDDSDLVTPEMEEARVKQMAVYDKYNQIIQSLNDAAGSFAKANIDLDWNVLGKDVSSSSSSSSKDTKEKLNWIERLIKRISTAYSRLKNVVSDTTSTWLNRNNALSDSMSTLRDEINAQSQAYEYYMNAFNGYGLDDYYKNQIANGSISIDVIYDEDLKNAISDCQDFYDKAQDAKTAVQELGIELRGLAKSRFDNLKSQYEEQINQITKTNDLLQKEADIIDTKGWFASTLLNNSFIEQEQKNLNKLKEERTALVNALNSAIDSGKIEEYSEDWYDMQSSIDDCTSSILDAEKALIEYDNAIRQINWDAFDRTRDDVEDLINETDFLVELLKDVGITDDNGNMTKEGQAAQALLAQKYQLYLNQAKAYKDEISKINEDLVNDPYDKELLDRKQDLIDKEQEAIKSAMSEKDAIKDLTNDAYTDFIDKLGDAIDKYKELMSTMKDAYDYEKSIREKTEALNALEKQYSAYQGDNSEEGKKNIQQLKDQINTAKDDLIQDIIEQSNENASDISQTINSTAENYGYNLSKPLLFSAKNVNYGKFN